MKSAPEKPNEATTIQNINIRKYALTASLLWCLVIFLSLFVNYQQRSKHFIDIGITIARSSFEKDILYRRWNASHGGVYAKQTDLTVPNPHLQIPERDLITPSGKPLTMINPAYMTRQVHELGLLENGVQGHITSLNPIRPENQPDPWEHQALEKFEQGTLEVHSVETLKGQPYLRYMRALITEQGCLKCHSQQGYKVGQIRGGISQSVPAALIQATMKGSLWPLWTGHILIFLIGLFFIWFAYLALHRKTTALQQSQRALSDANQELKYSQSKLLQSEKMASVGQLAAGVAHEINNPMGFISQNLSSLKKYVDKLTTFIEAQKSALAQSSGDDVDELKVLEKKLKLDYLLEDTKDLIDESLDGSKRVQTIVKNLKTFSRVDQNAVQSIDLNECIDSTLNIISNELKNKASIEKNYGDLPAVTCFPQQLSQVFMNLLINASHAIETQGIIKIRSWTDEGYAYVAISDNGSGISKENLNHIFEPFFTTKEVGKGTGLGLSMTYDIVKGHHGEISVKSEIDQGTTFTVRLPINSSITEE